VEEDRLKFNLKDNMPHRYMGMLMRVSLLALVSLLAACNSQTATRDFDAAGEDGIDQSKIKRGVAPQPDAEVAVIDTNYYGQIAIELYPNLAPEMVKRFKQLAGEGFYNNQTFHRIDSELGIIQGGDPLSKDGDPDNDGTGGSDQPDLPAEFSDVPFERGTLGSARSASPNSANSQFFITTKRQPAFDQRYTVFGRVIKGMNNVDVISTAPVMTGTDHPADQIVIKSITLQPRANFLGAQ
jgi:cyclophilin family peptidyl-prolyl cis-trans isomerase